MSEARDIIVQTCGAYDVLASEYAEKTEDYALFPGLKDEVVTFEKALPPIHPVLDLGCGGGRDSRLLAGLGRRVIAADYSMPMLQCARERSAGSPGNQQFVRLNMLDLPFADGVVAGVWASGSLLHLPSAKVVDALAEVLRVLTPGGCAAVSMRAGAGEGWRDGGTLEGRRWFTLVDPEEFASLMTRQGFREVRVREVGRRDWFVALGCK